MSRYILRKRTQGFVMVSSAIINVLKKKLAVLGFYNYLLNLPDNWHFYKTQVCKDCSIGMNRLDNYLRELKNLGLIVYGQERNAQGRFAQFYIDIYDKETVITNENNELDNAQPFYENHRTVETVVPSQQAIQNTYTQDTKNKTNNNCASDDARTPFPENKEMDKISFSEAFILFWVIYPRKENKKRAWDLWKKKKLDPIGHLIVTDVRNRLANHVQWKAREFIPHPSTYLSGERWNDEIVPETPVVRPNQPKPTHASVENQSTSFLSWEEREKRDREYHARMDREFNNDGKPKGIGSYAQAFIGKGNQTNN